VDIGRRIASLFAPAAHSVEWAQSVMRKTSDWNEVQEKAKRLVRDGKVKLHVNTPKLIAATVFGDHGVYHPVIRRDDPDMPWQWTQSEDTCPWEQYRWDRTRKWKKYEGRPCSHLLATYWMSLATPLDFDEDEEEVHAPGQRKAPLEQERELDPELQQYLDEEAEQVADTPSVFAPEDEPPVPSVPSIPETTIAPQPDNPIEPLTREPRRPKRQQMDITRREEMFDEEGNYIPPQGQEQ